MENKFENSVVIEGENTKAEEITEPKKKRGRPKKEVSTGGEMTPEKTTVKKEISKSSPEKSLDEIRKQYNTVQLSKDIPNASEEQKKEEAKKDFSKMVTGMMLLTVCDFIFPNIIMWFFKKKHPNLTIKKLKMTMDEKKELEPIADAAAEYLLVGMNPVQLFVLCMGATYFGKLQDAASE